MLLLTARERLHGLARHIESGEIVTAGKFLVLTGLVLPLLPDQPVTTLTDITPHQVWLAVLAVCTVSYASYLLQRYGAPPGRGFGSRCSAASIPRPRPPSCWRGGCAPSRRH